MANRDYDDARYARGDWDRDEWRRGSDDYRSQGREPSGRGYDEGRYGGGERGFAQYGQYGTRPEQQRTWFDDRRDAQSSGGGDYGRSHDYGRSQDYGRSPRGYGQGSYSSNTQSAYGRDWGHSSSYGPFGRPDYSRTQSNNGARESYSTQPFGEGGYRQEWSQRTGGPGISDWGDRRDLRGSESYRSSDRGSDWRQESYDSRGRDEEDFGQQVRHGMQQVASRVKRVFRGPKGYKRSDDRIREDVSDRLAHQNELDPSEIEVMVSNGEVTLSGTVQSRHEKFIAEEIADSVSGVNDVHNQLRVRREDVQSTTSTSTGATAVETSRQRNARA